MGRWMLIRQYLNTQSAKTCDLNFVNSPSALIVNDGALGERGVQLVHGYQFCKINYPLRHSSFRMKASPALFMRSRKGGEVVNFISIIAPGHAAWLAPSHERLRFPILPDLVESERHSGYPVVR